MQIGPGPSVLSFRESHWMVSLTITRWPHPHAQARRQGPLLHYRTGRHLARRSEGQRPTARGSRQVSIR